MARARHALFWPQYWTWVLTGHPVSEISYATSHGDLWSLATAMPAGGAMGQVTGGLFPAVRPAVAVAGPLAPGLPPGAGATGMGVGEFALPSPVIGVVSGCDGSTVVSTGFGLATPFSRSSDAEFAGTPSSFAATIFAGGPPHATAVEIRSPESPTQPRKRNTTEA